MITKMMYGAQSDRFDYHMVRLCPSAHPHIIRPLCSPRLPHLVRFRASIQLSVSYPSLLSTSPSQLSPTPHLPLSLAHLCLSHVSLSPTSLPPLSLWQVGFDEVTLRYFLTQRGHFCEVRTYIHTYTRRSLPPLAAAPGRPRTTDPLPHTPLAPSPLLLPLPSDPSPPHPPHTSSIPSPTEFSLCLPVTIYLCQVERVASFNLFEDTSNLRYKGRRISLNMAAKKCGESDDDFTIEHNADPYSPDW